MLKPRWGLVLLWSCGLLSLAGCGRDQETTAQAVAPTPEKMYEWKLVSTWPPNFPIFQEGVERFVNDVATLSQGRLKIKLFAGGELVPALQAFDAVSQGAVQLGHGAAYYWAGKVPAAQFMSAVPFGMTAKGLNAWFYGGDGLKLWQELYKPFNVLPFPMGNSGMQMGGWFNRKIDSMADLQGLKMRIPGLGGKVLAKAGGTPVLLAGGEIYTALERGTIDASEWVGPFHDERLGLNRIAKYYYAPGWHEPGTALELIVNQQAWASLPPDLQRVIEVTAMATNQWIYAQFEASNLAALQKLQQQTQVEVLSFPPAVLAALKALTAQVLAEESAKNPDFKRVYENYRAFSAAYEAWDQVSEVPYQAAVQAKP